MQPQQIRSSSSSSSSRFVERTMLLSMTHTVQQHTQTNKWKWGCIFALMLPLVSVGTGSTIMAGSGRVTGNVTDPVSHPVSVALSALRVAQPTVSQHWRENITFHGLAYPKLTWGLPTLSLTTNSSWLPWRMVAMPLISPLMPVPNHTHRKQTGIKDLDSASLHVLQPLYYVYDFIIQ